MLRVHDRRVRVHDVAVTGPWYLQEFIPACLRWARCAGFPRLAQSAPFPGDEGHVELRLEIERVV